MSKPTQDAIVRVLLKRFGQTYAHELGIDLARNTPSPLFCMLIAALLMSTRISTKLAMRGYNALIDAGWTTAQKMAQSTWRQRTDTLNHAGYARYDESTARYLGDTCTLLLEQYQGDLRKLREAGQRDPEQLRQLLKQCKGIGDVGADIFFREVQLVWDELYPFADKRALKAAQTLKLGSSAKALATLVSKSDLPRLLAALIRVDLHDAYDEIQADARQVAAS